MENQLGIMSEAELEVMREIWEIGEPVTVARMLDIFAPRRGWKISTLSTIMDRLIIKGYMTKTLKGKANIYSATVTEATYKENETRSFLSSVHHGSVKSFIAALTGGVDMSPDEIAEIRSWFLTEAGDV